MASMELATGEYHLCFSPSTGSSMDEVTARLILGENGEVSPDRIVMSTRVPEVTMFFVTPDGEPAEDCHCVIEPRDASSGPALHVDSANVGAATVQLAFFEPYTLRIDEEDQLEYEPQALSFSVRDNTFTAVVRRSLIGRIAEQDLAVVIDTSSALVHACLAKVAAGIRSALRTLPAEARFNIIAHAHEVKHWYPRAVLASPQAIEEAAGFCAALPLGTGLDTCAALEAAFGPRAARAVFFITGGDAVVDELFVKRVQVAYYRHQQRPRLHTVLLEGVPGEAAWKHMQALALLTRATFRPVSWGHHQQEGGSHAAGE